MNRITFFEFGAFIVLGVFVTALITVGLITALVVIEAGGSEGLLSILPSFLYLFGLSLFIAIPVVLWGWIVGFLPTNFVRDRTFRFFKQQSACNAIAGLLAALITSLPVLYLLVEDQLSTESSGASVAAALTIFVALVWGPIQGIYFFRPIGLTMRERVQ